MIFRFSSYINKNNFNLTGSIALRNSFFGRGSGLLHREYVFCTGSETRLLQCYDSRYYYCNYNDVAGVRCIDMPSESKLSIDNVFVMTYS